VSATVALTYIRLRAPGHHHCPVEQCLTSQKYYNQCLTSHKYYNQSDGTGVANIPLISQVGSSQTHLCHCDNNDGGNNYVPLGPGQQYTFWCIVD
jgi:hypothetical protein